MRPDPSGFTILTVKLWGLDRWMIYLDGEMYAGLFSSREQAQAYIERVAR